MIELLIRKLEQFGMLSNNERQALENLTLEVQQVGAGQDLVLAGHRSTHCLLLLSGMACRYRSLQDGQRQIMSFHFPGDILDLTGLLFDKLDHTVATLTLAEVAPISHATLQELIARHPGLGRLLWQDTLVDAAVFREWMVNVSRRQAYPRIAHLLCELVTRMQDAGLMSGQTCALPVTAAELVDATGLSIVRVNRVLQELRVKMLVELRSGVLKVLDWDGLQEAASFDPGYLHQRVVPPAT